MMHGRGEVRLRHSSCEAGEQSRATGCGAGGAKGGDQGECGPAKHAPDTGPGKRVTGAGPHTASSKAEEEGEVHRAAAPHQRRTACGRRSSRSSENAAAGVDGVTWRDYEADLERKLADLHARVHRGAYRALPSRRVYIPKPDGRQRPLAVAALEDKIVQRAVVDGAERDLRGGLPRVQYGFRPGRGPHDALDALAVGITSTKVNCILDADIRAFFDSVEPGMARPLPGAPDRRPAHHPPDPEMAEGGRPGRRGRDGQ